MTSCCKICGKEPAKQDFEYVSVFWFPKPKNFYFYEFNDITALRAYVVLLFPTEEEQKASCRMITFSKTDTSIFYCNEYGLKLSEPKVIKNYMSQIENYLEAYKNRYDIL